MATELEIIEAKHAKFLSLAQKYSGYAKALEPLIEDMRQERNLNAYADSFALSSNNKRPSAETRVTKGVPRPKDSGPFEGLSAAAAATVILKEMGNMHKEALFLEMKKREHPVKTSTALVVALSAAKGKFFSWGKGYWSLNPPDSSQTELAAS